MASIMLLMVASGVPAFTVWVTSDLPLLVFGNGGGVGAVIFVGVVSIVFSALLELASEFGVAMAIGSGVFLTLSEV